MGKLNRRTPEQIVSHQILISHKTKNGKEKKTKINGEIKKTGRGKTMTFYPWLTVYNAIHYGDIPYNEYPEEDDMESITLPSNSNQEKEIIKQDLFDKISKEAKEVIALILNSPTEIIETFITEKYKKISREKIKNRLIINGWKQQKVEKVFSELKTFVTNLDEV